MSTKTQDKRFNEVERALGSPAYRQPANIHSEYIPCPNSAHKSDATTPRFRINKQSNVGVCYSCNKAWGLDELAKMVGVN